MPSSLDTHAFQSAFGRLCDLSAQALANGVTRYEVQRAFMGRGPDLVPERHRAQLARIRTARRFVNQRNALVKHYAERDGISDRERLRAMIVAARFVRGAAEAEWMVTLPIVNPAP